MLSFRSYNVDFGCIKTTNDKTGEYITILDDAFIYIQEQFIEGRNCFFLYVSYNFFAFIAVNQTKTADKALACQICNKNNSTTEIFEPV